jgi:flavin-binding protein dodecin
MPERPRLAWDPSSVYRVVRLVAASPDSWEDATARGIAELAKSIADLRVARVAELDTVIRAGTISAYRVKLEASYRIDRRRLSESGESTSVRRYLVVANRTVGSPELERVVRERMAAGLAEFHVLVPTTIGAWALGAGMDPVSGYANSSGVAEVHEEAEREAESRLEEVLDRLRRAGVAATGEVGSSDPLAAVDGVLQRGSFDEVIVSTLPATVSRWLRLDLPRRIERRSNLPVTHVESEPL